MDQPLISVIVTTYNYAHTVGTAIDSALSQDYPNLEVVVVDNASTDATPALMERYAADPRVRYVRNPVNIGMVPNHNKGLEEATGAYVLFLSADDFLLAGHLSRSYAYLVAHPEIDVLYTGAYFVDEHERFIGVRQLSGQPLFPYSGGRNEFAGLLIEGCYMCFPTMLMRRDLYDRFGMLDEDIKAADYEIVIRWAANGVRFAYLPDATCAVRLHSSQQSSPQNYMADAGDIREFMYLIKRFAEPYKEQLSGFEMSVSRLLWQRLLLAKNAGVEDTDGSIRAEMDECDLLLSRVRGHNLAQPRVLRPTIVVLGSSRIADMERTFRSLLAQSHADWTAIVVESPGHGFAPLAAFVDPSGRIQTHRPLAPMPESVAINNALRIAPGNLFAVVHAGAELPADHIERVIALMDGDRQVECVRTAARLAIDGAGAGAVYDPFMPPNQQRLPWSVPFGPIESFVFTRALVDRGSFNERLPVFAEWEFFLRAALDLSIPALDSMVTVHTWRGNKGEFNRFAQLPQIAPAIYEAFRTSDPAIAAERDAFVRGFGEVLAAGPDVLSETYGLVHLFRASSGGLFAGAR